MNYYSIQNSWDKRIVGSMEPYEEVVHEINVNDDTHINNHYTGRIGYQPYIPKLILKKNAVLLDLMKNPIGIGSFKMVVSSKLKSLIETKVLDNFQFFEIDMVQNNQKVDGYWVAHPCKEQLEYVDFKKSDISINGTVGNIIKKVDIISILHYTDLRDELIEKGYNDTKRAFLGINKVNFKEDVKEELIILRNVKRVRHFFVSQPVKDKIETNQCTGIEFIPSNITHEDFFNENGYRHKEYGYWP